ncbi:hypothetical protein TI04_00885 [Achromatium sp. WMS2]|nr:hypothetical protein TI04_00885 [Achromatium sp. WMS2]
MPEYLITLETKDNQIIKFTCRNQEDVITAAERQQIILPQQCKSGVCGFCTAMKIHGKYTLQDYNPAALGPEQIATGKSLLCRTYPEANLTIYTNYNYSDIKFGQIPTVICSVLETQMVTSDVLHVIVKQAADGTDLISANMLAGQYVHILPIDRSCHRAYSIANTPNWDGLLEFYIENRSDGTLSSRLKSTQAGEHLLIQGPYGNFVIKEHGLKPRWFVAGGTGLSPILGMLGQMAELGEPHPTRLFFGLRYPKQLFAKEILDKLKSRLPDFDFQLCLSHPEPSWNFYQGSVLAALETAFSNTVDTPDVYICGSNRLIDSVVALANKYGINNQGIIYERFE